MKIQLLLGVSPRSVHGRPLGVLLLLVSSFSFLFPLNAQTVREDSFERLRVDYCVPELQLQSQPLGDIKALLPTLEGYRSGGCVGGPALPVRSDIIVIPFCDSIVVTVTDARYDTLDLSHLTSHFSLFSPLQRPRSKSAIGDYVIDYDTALYAADTLFGLPLVAVAPVGIARDRRLAHLRFSPLRVNTITGEAVLCRSATVTLSYVGSSPDSTLRHYRLYHTPAYTVGTTLNRLFTDKDATLTTPLRMIIAVGEGLSGSSNLDEFVQWKRSQGLLVDLIYADSIPGFTSQFLTDTLGAIYNAATTDNPAPLYVILIGDHEQIPAFENRLAPDNWVLGDDFTPHITDHYFATWTADNIRDCYLGRLSATNCSSVNTILEKTMFYERYLFADDSYLSKAVLVAGIDYSSWAFNYADPSLDYAALHYINANHGINQVTYGKNNTSIDPSAPGVTVVSNYDASLFRNLYDEGMGFVNYSAHGSATSWSNPSFTVSHISSMSNYGKPSVMIGNCCLSNHFQTPECFGEALLRKASAGAAAYIGATNSTYWDDDLFWSMGYRTNVGPHMDLSHNAVFSGAYDHLFHEYGEQPAVTIGGMLHAGLMSVNLIYDLDEYGPSMVPYYWEIYELMGDPSLIPWMGQAYETGCSIAYAGQTLTVNTVPGAYVAFVDSLDYRLLSASFANTQGQAQLSLADTVGHTPMLSITSQHHKPYFRSLRHGNIGIKDSPLSASLSPLVYPNPATDNVTIKGLPEGSRIDLLDATGRTLSTHRLQLSPFTIHLEGYPAGVYFLRISNAAGIHTEKVIKK
ncbi:MAG: C25 family cysteine peptidase [bacterium]